MFVYHFVDSDLGIKTLLEKQGQQNKGTLILKYGLMHLLHTNVGDRGKFHAEPFCFFLKKE